MHLQNLKKSPEALLQTEEPLSVFKLKFSYPLHVELQCQRICSWQDAFEVSWSELHDPSIIFIGFLVKWSMKGLRYWFRASLSLKECYMGVVHKQK
jgi:hypothetical protein